MVSLSGDHSQMCVSDKGGAPPVYLLLISLYNDQLGSHLLAGSDGVVPVPLGLGEEVTVSMEERPVPGAGLTQSICWGKQIRWTYLEALAPISL